MPERLHFDPFFWFAAKQSQQEFADEFKDRLYTLKRSVQNLITDSWESPAAIEFATAFDEWASKETTWFDEILDIIRRLEVETQEWLDTADTLAS